LKHKPKLIPIREVETPSLEIDTRVEVYPLRPTERNRHNHSTSKTKLPIKAPVSKAPLPQVQKVEKKAAIKPKNESSLKSSMKSHLRSESKVQDEVAKRMRTMQEKHS
jgi:hypothetical protein